MSERIETIARIIGYERAMFRHTYKRFEQPHQDRLDRNVNLECFLLHTRILCEFLCNKKPKPKANNKTDIVASHALPVEWVAQRGPYLEANWKRLQQSLAHVTFDREPLIAVRRAKNWEPLKIWREVNAMWREFLQQVPESQRHLFDR